MQLEGTSGRERFEDFLRKTETLPSVDFQGLKMRKKPTELFKKMQADLVAAQERIIASRNAILRALASNEAIQEAQALEITSRGTLDVTRNSTIVPMANVSIEGLDLNGSFAVLNSGLGDFSISTLLLNGDSLGDVSLNGLVKRGRMTSVIFSARNFKGGTELNQMMKWNFESGKPEFLVGGEAQNPTAIRFEKQRWEMGHIQPYLPKRIALQAVHIQTPSYTGTSRSR